MKQSERNLMVIENFILHLTHSNEGDHDADTSTPYTANELYQAAKDYIEEDHADGKPADEEVEKEYHIFHNIDGERTTILHTDEAFLKFVKDISDENFDETPTTISEAKYYINTYCENLTLTIK